MPEDTPLEDPNTNSQAGPELQFQVSQGANLVDDGIQLISDIIEKQREAENIIAAVALNENGEAKIKPLFGHLHLRFRTFSRLCVIQTTIQRSAR